MDQLAAQELGKATEIASLELGIESNAMLGSCDGGASCAYTNTIAWRTPTTPLPPENDPRAVFERLFGTSGSTDPEARLARMRRDRSILDVVGDSLGNLERRIGRGDRMKLDEYLTAVRDAERRIAMAEQNSRELPSRGSAARDSQRLRRAREAHDGSAGAGVPDGPHAHQHFHAGSGSEQPRVS